MNRRRFLQLAAGAAAVAVGTPIYAWSEAHRFEVSRHTLKLPGLRRAVKLAHLSDLHFGRWHREDAVGAWVQATLRERPDLIVLTGDIADRLPTAAHLEGLALELARLRAPLGVFAVLGNHDYWRPRGAVSTGEFVARLERAGVEYLTNAGRTLRDDLFLAGVDDFWHGTPDLKPALRDQPRGAASLLLCHNPDFLPTVPPNVGLTLCGHTHGGQIRAPFGVSLYSISKYGDRFQQGFVRNDAGARAFVSRGLGTAGAPVRTFCPAELAVLTLEP